jgi:hypothetical protein
LFRKAHILAQLEMRHTGKAPAALLVALPQTPHRFRTKRQLWAYSGFAVEAHDSGEYRDVRGKPNRERITVRGLSDNYNKDLKNLFKGAAISVSTRPGPLHDFYVARIAKRDAADDGPSDPGTKAGLADAEVELNAFDCIQPQPRVQSSSH